MEKVTTTEAHKILRERGFQVPYSTIARWAQSGLFEGAERDDSHPRGPLWLIPRKSVLKFEPPKTGRPPKAKPGKASGQDGRVIVTKKGSKE